MGLWFGSLRKEKKNVKIADELEVQAANVQGDGRA